MKNSDNSQKIIITNSSNVGMGNINHSIRIYIDKSGASDDLKVKLVKLTEAFEFIIKEMPKEAADEAKDDLEKFITEATSEKPKRKWYSVSGEGLIEAAKAIGSLGEPVIKATQDVLKLLDSFTS